ncbi:class I SAM-dependent methyltransferase [Acidiphilium multivorum]|uniref:class I SAM-dependent methyltransferase n=1 Tax=Acidiphilium multivorum TaxID=62140 RepID=UPI0039C951DD
MTADNAALVAWTARVAQATRKLLPKGGDLAWLLRQSMHTHFQRLAVLPVFGLSRGPVRVLDVGAGTGALCLDLAWMCGPEARITAVDNDAHGLSLLRDLAAALHLAVDARLADAYALPVESASQGPHAEPLPVPAPRTAGGRARRNGPRHRPRRPRRGHGGR